MNVQRLSEFLVFLEENNCIIVLFLHQIYQTKKLCFSVTYFHKQEGKNPPDFYGDILKTSWTIPQPTGMCQLQKCWLLQPVAVLSLLNIRQPLK